MKNITIKPALVHRFIFYFLAGICVFGGLLFIKNLIQERDLHTTSSDALAIFFIAVLLYIRVSQNSVQLTNDQIKIKSYIQREHTSWIIPKAGVDVYALDDIETVVLTKDKKYVRAMKIIFKNGRSLTKSIKFYSKNGCRLVVRGLKERGVKVLIDPELDLNLLHQSKQKQWHFL